MSGVRRTCGVYTERWGWQPHAWPENGLPTFAWRTAPAGLLTRRQMRDAGLAPGGAYPAAQIVCRRGRVRALLFDRNDLTPKRVASAAQLQAVGKALAARRWCPECRTDAGYCIPTSLGRCIACEYPATPARDWPAPDDTGVPDSGTAGVAESVSPGDDIDRPGWAA